MWLVFQPEVVLMSPKEGKPISKTGSDRHGDRWKVVHAWQKRVAKGLSTDDKPGWSQIARECNKPRCFVERWVTRSFGRLDLYKILKPLGERQVMDSSWGF